MSEASKPSDKRRLDAASSLVLLRATRDAVTMQLEALQELFEDRNLIAHLEERQTALLGTIQGCAKCAASYTRDLLEAVDCKNTEK